MPEINGPDFYQIVALKHPDLANRILFTSGDLASQSTRMFIEKSGISCLDKPFELEELLEYVHSKLEDLT